MSRAESQSVSSDPFLAFIWPCSGVLHCYCSVLSTIKAHNVYQPCHRVLWINPAANITFLVITLEIAGIRAVNPNVGRWGLCQARYSVLYFISLHCAALLLLCTALLLHCTALTIYFIAQYCSAALFCISLYCTAE